MSNKGDQTRTRIKQISRRLFASQGFSSVTMQDICDACGLSRGGLYRHYISTGEIFCAILADEEQEAVSALQHALAQKVPASRIFHTFLLHRIRAVANPETSIENAVTEFAAQDRKGSYMLHRRAETSIAILTEMISKGVHDGDFTCSAPEAVAKHVLWIIEGIAKHCLLMPLTEDEINGQILLIKKLLTSN